MIMSEGVLNYINKLETTPVVCEKSEISQLAFQLKEAHQEKEVDILATMGIHKRDIIKGVQCPHCENYMKWHRRSWECKDCGERNQRAHLRTLEDYALLFSPLINNHTARDFLMVDSASSVKRILTNLKSLKTGGRKFRSYYIPLSPFQ
ncbi:transposase [Halobacillus massiliensis]|uniref:transposase n=1 Tax=Halobacillus massiliensis TaxID=1926286 RepID=UPI001179FBFF|nr:transposase [Halobacillus massiliensis]